MALLGKAAIAMWWDMAPDWRDEFEHWHSHEHFSERMGIPGFLRGSRWADAGGGESFFVMYELDRYETLTSTGYLERLNQPTPWSTKLMPQHRHMVRSQCHVLESVGGGLAGYALTVRLSPAAGQENELRQHLKMLAQELSARPGSTGAHLLQTQTPAIAATTEQKIRGGGDQAADWIYVVCGYAFHALEQLSRAALSPRALGAHGARGDCWMKLYRLSHTSESFSRSG